MILTLKDIGKSDERPDVPVPKSKDAGKLVGKIEITVWENANPDVVVSPGIRGYHINRISKQLKKFYHQSQRGVRLEEDKVNRNSKQENKEE